MTGVTNEGVIVVVVVVVVGVVVVVVDVVVSHSLMTTLSTAKLHLAIKNLTHKRQFRPK